MLSGAISNFIDSFIADNNLTNAKRAPAPPYVYRQLRVDGIGRRQFNVVENGRTTLLSLPTRRMADEVVGVLGQAVYVFRQDNNLLSPDETRTIVGSDVATIKAWFEGMKRGVNIDERTPSGYDADGRLLYSKQRAERILPARVGRRREVRDDLPLYYLEQAIQFVPKPVTIDRFLDEGQFKKPQLIRIAIAVTGSVMNMLEEANAIDFDRYDDLVHGFNQIAAAVSKTKKIEPSIQYIFMTRSNTLANLLEMQNLIRGIAFGKLRIASMTMNLQSIMTYGKMLLEELGMTEKIKDVSAAETRIVSIAQGALR